MYRFLDRRLTRLDSHHHFLIAAMRQWTLAARSGRCACAALAAGFSRQGVAGALPDFATAMTALDHDAERWLRFGAAGSPCVEDDEARLLVLFQVALEGDAGAVRRIASTLVAQGAAERLAAAVEWVALRLLQASITEND